MQIFYNHAQSFVVTSWMCLKHLNVNHNLGTRRRIQLDRSGQKHEYFVTNQRSIREMSLAFGIGRTSSIRQSSGDSDSYRSWHGEAPIGPEQ